MIFITGDTHREFNRIINFTKKFETTKKDIMIILGDVGVNYYGKENDDELKKLLSELPVTLFCIHGNHEMRPTAAWGLCGTKLERWSCLHRTRVSNLNFC